MGAGSMNYEQLAQEVEMYTGGLSLGPHIVPHHTDQDKFELVSVLRDYFSFLFILVSL